MPEPTMQRATSLADIEPSAVPVPIRLPNGRSIEVLMLPLSEGQMWDLRRSITWPVAPVTGVSKTAQIRDYQDAGYLAAVGDCNRLFVQRLLLACLQLEIPGDNEDEKLAALRKQMGQTVYAQLVEAAQGLNIITPEEVAHVAATFRGVRHGGAPGNGDTGADAEPVAEPAAR